MINSRVLRTGDGSHRNAKKTKKSKEDLNQTEDSRDLTHFWGFGDKEMTAEDMKKIKIIRKLQAWKITEIVGKTICITKHFKTVISFKATFFISSKYRKRRNE